MSRIQIKNGMVYDGLGNMPVKADVWIFNDRIEKIAVRNSGEENLAETKRADEVIDAEGKVVTPGFIDIHRHCDIKPFYGTEFGTCMLAQGITTAVSGNCGISMTPCSKDGKRAREMQNFQEAVLGPAYAGIYTYGEYLRELEKRDLPVNFAAMIGIGSIKIAVKGFADTPFSKLEMEEAVSLVEDAMRQGAPGISAGIMYLPECYSTAEEYGELLKPVGQYGRVAAFHIRGEGDSMVESIQEVIEIGKRAGCAVEISHFKSCGMNNWKKEIHRAIQLIDEARQEGQDITVDFYPYEGGSTALTTMLPPEFTAGDMERALESLGTDEGIRRFRQSASRKYEDWDNYCITLGWNRIFISGAAKEHNRKFLGMDMETAARQFGYEDTYALAAWLMHDESGKTAIINMSMCQEDIDTVAKLPYSIVISDSIYAETDTPHPRMYGAFPKILREYVKERHILTLEEAIKKMTSMPAKRMKILDRGVLKAGMYADLNIFDPGKFRDCATFQNPAVLACGLDVCMVNGIIAYRNGMVINRDGGRVVCSKPIM